MKNTKRWFPRAGDLVAVPYEGNESVTPGVRPRASYGVVIGEPEKSDFPGVWWNVFAEGDLHCLHIHLIKPIMDLKGKWISLK